MTVWSEPSHIILKLGGYTLDHISEKLLRGLCDIWMPGHFEPGLFLEWGTLLEHVRVGYWDLYK